VPLATKRFSDRRSLGHGARRLAGEGRRGCCLRLSHILAGRWCRARTSLPRRDALLARPGVTKTIPRGSSLEMCAVGDGAADLWPRVGPRGLPNQRRGSQVSPDKSRELLVGVLRSRHSLARWLPCRLTPTSRVHPRAGRSPTPRPTSARLPAGQELLTPGRQRRRGHPHLARQLVEIPPKSSRSAGVIFRFAVQRNAWGGGASRAARGPAGAEWRLRA
jgi:hypothetical protein